MRSLLSWWRELASYPSAILGRRFGMRKGNGLECRSTLNMERSRTRSGQRQWGERTAYSSVTLKPKNGAWPLSTSDESNKHSTRKLRKDWLRLGDNFTQRTPPALHLQGSDILNLALAFDRPLFHCRWIGWIRVVCQSSPIPSPFSANIKCDTEPNTDSPGLSQYPKSIQSPLY
jgi:hypothetical protein